MSAADATMSPGAWLRMQRVAAGLTQEDLAERSGVSVRTIADLERGRTRRPYPSSVRALASALGVSAASGTELIARYRASAHAVGDESPAGMGPQPGSWTVPRQLPTAVPYFSGRARELGLLDQMLRDRSNRREGVVISVIGGTAGIGKTRLRCTGRTGWPAGSPTGSSTRTCAVSIRPEDRRTRPA